MPRCNYCTEDFDGFKAVLDKNGHAVIHKSFPDRKPILVIRAYGRRWEVQIRFCPMCGRELKGGEYAD